MSALAAKRGLRLREDWARQSSPCRVDREAGAIYDVKVCGAESTNRRRYPAETFKKAVAAGVYEGAKVYADHPTRPGEQRPVRGILGKLEGVHEKGGELYARKMLVLKSHPLAESVFEDCERALGVFGLSHNAEAGDWHMEGGHQVITEILRVESVDLVSSPATNTSLWEGRKVADLTLKEWLDEKSADRTLPPVRRKKILEMAEQLGDNGPVMADEPGAVDGRKLLGQAVAALVQSDDPADHELATKVMRLLKPTSEEPALEQADDGEDDDEEKKPKEGRRARSVPAPAVLTEAEAAELCALADLMASRALVESLTGLPEANARKLILAQKGLQAQARRVGGPPRSASGHVPEAAPSRAPAGRAEALKWLRE